MHSGEGEWLHKRVAFGHFKTLASRESFPFNPTDTAGVQPDHMHAHPVPPTISSYDASPSYVTLVRPTPE